jgi:ribosome maturation factor RimP
MRQDLVDLIKPVVESLGFALWGVEFKPAAGGSVLRVFIDKEEGIAIEDCEAVSRQLSRILDVEDPIVEEYVLEVSSPGLNPVLFFVDQYPNFCGEVLQVKTQMAIESQKNFKGLLKKVNEDSIEIEDHDRIVRINFDNIAKASVVTF